MERFAAAKGSAGWLQRLAAFLVSIGVLPFLLAVALLILGYAEPRVWSADNLFNVARQSTYLMVAAMGQMLVLLTGNFDLSVGSNIALVSVTTTLAMSSFLRVHPDATLAAIAIGILAGLSVGVAVGAANGFGVAVMKVHSFIMTLGTASIVFGIALMITGGLPVTGLPRAFGETLAYGRFLGMPAPLIAAAAIFAVLYFLLHWTRFGRYLYAIGSNSRAARLSGIPVGLHLFLAHTLCALVVAASAILLTARVNTGEARIGEQYALASITACVLGGVSLFGGSGRIASVILGAFFLTLLTNGMTMLRIGSFAQIIADGALLIFAVWAEQGRLRLSHRREQG